MTHADSVQRRLEVDKADIAYIVGVFEAYENFAVVRTLDQSKGLIELMISPDFQDETRQLLDHLGKEVPLRDVS